MIVSDHLTCGSISDMIAPTTKTLINYGFFLWGITGTNYPGLILEILLKAPQKTHLTCPFLLAMVIDSIIGAFIGIMIIYILKIVGRRYLWYKAIIFGSFIWLIGPVITLPRLYTELSFNFFYISLLDHWILGFVIVTLIDRLYPLNTTQLAHTEV
jgi:hypothetical protein